MTLVRNLDVREINTALLSLQNLLRNGGKSGSGNIYNTYNNSTNKMNDVPVGTICSYLGNTDPSDGKWLICDGRDTTGTAIELETHYPSLYMFLGGTNVLPYIVDRNSPLDYTRIVTRTVTGGRTDTWTATDAGLVVASFTGFNSASGSLSINNVLVTSNTINNNALSTGGGGSVFVEKGDVVKVYQGYHTTTCKWSFIPFSKYKIIKAVSSVDMYHAPASEITQIESYVDTGFGNFLTQLNTWVDVSSDFSVVDQVNWANTPTSSLKVLYNAYQKRLKVWSWYNSTKSASSTHAFTLQYDGNNTDIVFDPITTIAMQTLNKSYLGYDTTTNPDSAPNSNGFECSYNIRTSKQIRLGGYNRNGSTTWGANICLVAEISL